MVVKNTDQDGSGSCCSALIFSKLNFLVSPFQEYNCSIYPYRKGPRIETESFHRYIEVYIDLEMKLELKQIS